MTRKLVINNKVIEIDDENKEVLYKSKTKLISGYILTLILFPIAFAFISMFIFIVCTYEGIKAFCKEFCSTARYIKWGEATKLVALNCYKVLFYKKRRVEDKEQ